MTNFTLQGLFAEPRRDDNLSEGTRPSTGLAVPGASGVETLRIARARFERDYIATVLERHHWRVPEVACALGIDPANLYRKMRRLGISRTQEPPVTSSGE